MYSYIYLIIIILNSSYLPTFSATILYGFELFAIRWHDANKSYAPAKYAKQHDSMVTHRGWWRPAAACDGICTFRGHSRPWIGPGNPSYLICTNSNTIHHKLLVCTVVINQYINHIPYTMFHTTVLAICITETMNDTDRASMSSARLTKGYFPTTPTPNISQTTVAYAFLFGSLHIMDGKFAFWTFCEKFQNNLRFELFCTKTFLHRPSTRARKRTCPAGRSLSMMKKNLSCKKKNALALWVGRARRIDRPAEQKRLRRARRKCATIKFTQFCALTWRTQ